MRIPSVGSKIVDISASSLGDLRRLVQALDINHQ